MMNRIALALALLSSVTGTLTAAEPATSQVQAEARHARPKDVGLTRLVRFADLDLTTSAGKKSLNRSVGRAVFIACREATGPDPIDWEAYACEAEAWRDARPQIAQAIARTTQRAPSGTNVARHPSLLDAHPAADSEMFPEPRHDFIKERPAEVGPVLARMPASAGKDAALPEMQGKESALDAPQRAKLRTHRGHWPKSLFHGPRR